jgi:Ca2+-binding EF-hand superfamily protein
MKKGCLILVALIMVLSAASIAAAQAKKPAVARTVFSQMDANGDGMVTVTEHAAFWQGRFKDIDKDRDGKLTAAEFSAATKAFFGDMDTDKDGVLVAKEYVAFWCGPKAAAKAVAPEKIKATPRKKLDANQNGKIDDDECLVFWSANFFDLDSNHDGKVTLDEFTAGMTKRFNEIDKNKDGFISIEEHAVFWSGKTAVAKAAK